MLLHARMPLKNLAYWDILIFPTASTLSFHITVSLGDTKHLKYIPLYALSDSHIPLQVLHDGHVSPWDTFSGGHSWHNSHVPEQELNKCATDKNMTKQGLQKKTYEAGENKSFMYFWKQGPTSWVLIRFSPKLTETGRMKRGGLKLLL